MSEGFVAKVDEGKLIPEGMQCAVLFLWFERGHVDWRWLGQDGLTGGDDDFTVSFYVPQHYQVILVVTHQS